jgi:hypothetical protein
MLIKLIILLNEILLSFKLNNEDFNPDCLGEHYNRTTIKRRTCQIAVWQALKKMCSLLLQLRL